MLIKAIDPQIVTERGTELWAEVAASGRTGKGCNDEELSYQAIAEPHSGLREGWHIIANTLHGPESVSRSIMSEQG